MHVHKGHLMNQIEPSNSQYCVAQTGYDDEFWTIRQFCEAYRWPSESAMRAYIHRADELGIGEAFSRVGRRVLVLPKKFFALIQGINDRVPNKKGNIYVRKT